MINDIKLTNLTKSSGCAAKIGPATLESVLKNLPKFNDNNLIVGFDKKDDANIHKYDIGYGRKDSMNLNLVRLRNCVSAAVSKKVEDMKFEVGQHIIEVKAKKVLHILNEMIIQ